MLKTNKFLETMLNRDTSELMWEHIKPPVKSENDPIVLRGKRVARFPRCIVNVPRSAELDSVDTLGDAGKYTHVNINGVDVHFREGLNVVPGEVLVGDVVVYVKTWEPQMSDESRDAYRNYMFCVNVELCASPSPEATHRLYIQDTKRAGYRRRHSDMGGGNTGVFAHRSFDKRRDQHLFIAPLSSEALDETQPNLPKMAESSAHTALGDVDGQASTSIGDLLRDKRLTPASDI